MGIRILLAIIFVSSVLPVFGQKPPTCSDAPTVTSQPCQQAAARDEQNHSVLTVKPDTEAIKNTDLYERTGYWHPFLRMPGFVLNDQKRIWTSPFHTAKKDIKWWAIFGGATATLIVFDEQIQKNAPNPPALVTVGTSGSDLGTAYALIPISAGFYFIGSKTANERFRESGLLGFEAMINATLVEEALKIVADRQRPLEGTGEGNFFHSANRLNSSFPSGHSINTFALASVFAHEYSHTWWVKVLAYAYAGGVAAARLAANRHFPSDTLAGGAIGWFIGDYVYGKRHNSDLDQKPAISQRILEHVHFGGSGY
jgi:membrane-associated phospholipid phosphatase